MIKNEKIKELADGKCENQYVTVTIEAKSNIMPAVIFNVYLNLDMEFIYMMEVIKQGKLNAIMPQERAFANTVNVFFFKTRRLNFEKHFGHYQPNKILKFEIGNRNVNP